MDLDKNLPRSADNDTKTKLYHYSVLYKAIIKVPGKKRMPYPGG